MKTDINEIASKHLGRTSDGKVMQAYVTPTEIEPDLLVPIPRELNRTQYEIDENSLPFVGYDVWNAYEVSCMTSTGLPVSVVLKIVYSSDSKYIVESKSLKLYLNSFNMVRLDSVYPQECVDAIKKIVEEDLSSRLETKVEVKATNASEITSTDLLDEKYISDDFLLQINSDTKRLETEDDIVKNIRITEYNENPDILEIVEAKSPAFYCSSLLRSNCRVTNQTDWGDIFIFVEGDKIVTRESMLAYIISMRNENHFHEEICECVYKRLLDKLAPNRLVVGCLYTRRGGIDINPIRSKLEKDLNIFNIDDFRSSRTIRQ